MVVVVVVVGVVAGVVVGVVGSVGGCVGVGVVVVSSGLGVENWQCSYTLLGQSHTGPSRPWYLTQHWHWNLLHRHAVYILYSISLRSSSKY